MQRLTVKTSTIFVAKRGETKIYHSVNELPAKLRQELDQSTNSFNSATILIADRRGRQEIIKALSGMPSGLRSRIATTLDSQNSAASGEEGAGQPSAGSLGFVRRNWLEISLPVAVSLIVWVAYHFR